MDKENSFAPIILIGLFIAFAIISILLFLTGNRRLLSRKLKIGAAIISLTTFMSTGSVAQSCYIVPAPDSVLNKKSYSQITLDSNQFADSQKIYQNLDTIKGKIIRDWNSEITYEIINAGLPITSGKVIIHGDNFFIPVKELKEGKLVLHIFEEKESNPEKREIFLQIFDIIPVKKEDEIYNTCYFY